MLRTCIWLQRKEKSHLYKTIIPTMKPLDDVSKKNGVSANAQPAVAAAPVVEEKIDLSNVKIEPIFKDMWILRPSPSPITAP